MTFYGYISESSYENYRQQKNEEQNLPIQSLFKAISINIKLIVCVLWRYKSICIASMIGIEKIKCIENWNNHIS